jgi:hypothetical protein
MSLPTPEFSLANACTTVYNNTLYAYSSEAFQALPIKSGGQWSTLPMGVSVTGGQCVKATPQNGTTPMALYIVGGTANSSMSSYEGLQRYKFDEGTWETIIPTASVAKDRLYHSAVYLNTSQSILMYAGSQDGTEMLSSQTFTIDTEEPYNIISYESIAPPAISPLLMPWTESKAVMIGGSNDNKKVMVFSPSLSWVDSNATLAEPLKNSSMVKAIVINGNDGSKNLYSFDMSVAPNQVNRTILIDANGNPVADSAPITKRSESSVAKRDDALTLDDWPTYNDSDVSMTIRTNYGMAKDQSGMTYITSENAKDNMCVFKARENVWVNATTIFKTANKSVTNGLGNAAATTSSVSASSTASSSASSTPKNDAALSRAVSLKILAAVLGSVMGLALILLTIIICLRWHTKRKARNQGSAARQGAGTPQMDEKSQMDFMDRGLDLPPPPGRRGHEAKLSQDSVSSMAILMGRVGNHSGHQRGAPGNGSMTSDASSMFNKNYKTAVSNPMSNAPPNYDFATTPTFPQRAEKGLSTITVFAPGVPPPAPVVPERVEPEPIDKTRLSVAARKGDTRRSSGWNRYWSGGSAMNILGLGSKRTTYNSDRSSNSQYSDVRVPSQVTQVSAMPQPLQIPQFDGQALGRVRSASPTVSQAPSINWPAQSGIQGTVRRSMDEDSDDGYLDEKGFEGGLREPEQAWQQPPSHGQGGWASGRAVSNAYTESDYGTLAGAGESRVDIGHYPNVPSTRMPEQPQQHSRGWSQGGQHHTSDMSWLNLGEHAQKF